MLSLNLESVFSEILVPTKVHTAGRVTSLLSVDKLKRLLEVSPVIVSPVVIHMVLFWSFFPQT